ncbi:TPA: hypothetical protein N0F65_011411 [Lagenidium giganteum]|uniref:Aldehyde dehydrogenase domain-containing protein n=1 Tax=Lagenidium giganteum TaxID=4803 RepID=A0AAV2ZC28_9STRA|nr:TPA: hypothetical protein N0F65_011411 [Lagenidium giganteum]
MQRKGLSVAVAQCARSSPFRAEYGLFLDGREVPSTSPQSVMAVENPATTEHLTWIARATPEDVHQAVCSGATVFDSGVWSKAPVVDRSRTLHDIGAALRARIADLAEMESLQTGRPIREMRAQLTRLPEWFEYFAALIRTSEGSVPPFSGSYINYVRRMPLGVVGQITPWNHPLLIAVKKLAPALAAGNSVVLKPSELAPVSVLELAAICHSVGLPSGVLNCVPGMGVDAGKALAGHPLIKKVDFTGGTATGREVAALAARNLASSTMELGGKAPLVVFDDVELDDVVNGAAFASFIASGQTCVTGSRIIVHERLFEQFVDRFVRKVSSIRVGDPMDVSTQMGSVISKHHLDRIDGMVQRARAQGAHIRCGGKRVAGLEGYFYEPTVITNVTEDMEIVQEEVFGPVVVVYSFKDEQDGIRKANNSCYGLGAAVWSKDIKRAHRVADALDAGIVWLNDHHRNDPSSPWGGMKQSGIGRENGAEALRAYSQAKSVVAAFGDEKFDWFVNDTVRYG